MSRRPGMCGIVSLSLVVGRLGTPKGLDNTAGGKRSATPGERGKPTPPLGTRRGWITQPGVSAAPPPEEEAHPAPYPEGVGSTGWHRLIQPFQGWSGLVVRWSRGALRDPGLFDSTPSGYPAPLPAP